MPSSDSRKYTVIASLLITLGAGSSMLLITDLEPLKLSIIALLIFIVSVLIISGLIYFYFIRRIRYLTEAVTSLIQKRNGKFQREQSNKTDLEKLDFRIKQLVREKSGEIERLKELEQYRRQFLGNVAHELRTPIFSIQGYVHTLKDGALHDEAVNMRFLEKTAKNVDNLTNLVEDLMTISKIESGNHTIERQSFDVNSLIREVFESLDWMAKKKHITQEVRITGARPVNVIGDKEMIRQVLVNLVANGIKYGKEDGRILVKLNEQNGLVKIDVTDDGEGIAAEHLPRIFERFYRVDKSRSKAQGGTGLGLAIVKHFIEAHGQKIHVNSSPGIGTTFSFCLDSAGKAG